MDWFFDPQIWAALITLTALEIVLGIDNIIVIAIVTGKLPREDQARARNIGLSLAIFTRTALLSSLFFLSQIQLTLFITFGEEISVRDLVPADSAEFFWVDSNGEMANHYAEQMLPSDSMQF